MLILIYLLNVYVCVCAVTRAFCQWQTLDINCTDTQVILVMSARYGRMKIGHCVAKNYGYVGCSVDVVGHLASLCSGRTSCRFEVPDVKLKQLHPCPKDFASYLEMSYVCIPGTLHATTSLFTSSERTI